MIDCRYCRSTAILTENSHWYAKCVPFNDGYTLIIPKRHVESYFDLEYDEVETLDSMLTDVKHIIDRLFKPDGYSIGMNIGVAAGQKIAHHHIDMIPRYVGLSQLD